MFAIQVVEARRHVACHLNVLDLIAAHRHFVRLEHQNVGAHEHRVHEQAGRYIGIGVVASRVVFIDGGFVGVCSIEQAFARDASEKPSQFWNFWNVGLAVKHDALRVKARGNPAGGNF